MADGFEFEALPFREAVEFFRAKGLAVGFDYRDVWQSEHQRAFTVAKAMTIDLLESIRAAVDKAVADGIAFEDFRDNLEPVLRALGWWGRAEMVDPLTGKKREVQLGSSRRLEIIYDTNLRTSYSEGRWRQMQRIKHRRPYVRYMDPDPNPRPQHLAWSGTVVPVDSDWAAAHWPPLGWNCFPGETRVACVPSLGLKTRYAGEIVEFQTILGHRLAVTANHPILTRRGWLAAQEIQEGDETLGAIGRADTPRAVVARGGIVNYEEPVASVEDLFEALTAQGFRVAPMAAHDFHGDALAMKDEIQIAGADRALMDIIDAAARQLGGELSLAGRERRETARFSARLAQTEAIAAQAMFGKNAEHLGLGEAQALGEARGACQVGAIERKHAALARIVAGVRRVPRAPEKPLGFLAARCLREGLDAAPASSRGVFAPAQLKPGAAQPEGERAAAAPGLFGELLERNSGAIARDQIVKIRKYQWRGHVYDFVTGSGLIVAGGVVVSNCKCYMQSASEDEVARYGWSVSEPVTEYSEYTNPRTGAVSRVPAGVDPSFAYPPGRANEAVDAALADKLAAADPAIAKAVRRMKPPRSSS